MGLFFLAKGFKEQSNGTLKHSLRIPILAKEDPYKQFHLVGPQFVFSSAISIIYHLHPMP